MTNPPPIATSVFEIFKIGVGPSSSHTMGPMVAAAHFRRRMLEGGLAGRAARIRCDLLGSLGATGKGHATDRAIIAGLCGLQPATLTGEAWATAVRSVRAARAVRVDGASVAFDPRADLRWLPLAEPLPHPNTVEFAALDAAGAELLKGRYLSVGGGFVEIAEPDGRRTPLSAEAARGAPRHAFTSGVELMRICKRGRLRWCEVALQNEAAQGRPEAAVRAGLLEIWRAMRDCIRRGVEADPQGKLPGPLNVYRRAPGAYATARSGASPAHPLPLTDPVDLLAHAYALAVNEENAAGGRVVTAPTNGAAGVIPAAFAALQDGRGLPDERIVDGLLTAGLVGALIKRMASLSGAEMGCQGEVGSACAMAAAGVVEILAGTPDQVEMAAEIGIEHHLGMTCDPIAGLVQIPCIERNVMGAVKALHAATLALGSSGKHRISLDEAIAAMRQIGLDMNAKYKETARGGLATISSAPHHVEC